MLSVLIPTYNYDITKLVKEVHAQCTAVGVVFEIIAADDCSAHEYLINNRSINCLSQTKLLENKANFGRTQTRKILAEAAQFDMLLFLDADVLPAADSFIEKYLPYLQEKAKVVFGGYAYLNEKPESTRMLRYKYGKEREEKNIELRNKNPYGFVFSGNILLQKEVFMAHNFSGEGKFYGLDVWFSHRLYKAGVPVIQIDNPIYHLGIEENSIFFKKALDSVATKKELMECYPEIGIVNPLMKSYRLLKIIGLKPVAKLGFKLTEPVLRKMIMNSNPNLFILDIYRLGYLCSL